MTDEPILLRMTNICKAFHGVPALEDACLEVRPAEVHALVGQNGAGKSTMIKILTGAYTRDSGTIWFNGKEVDFRSPKEAQDNGISTIYQEINLVPLRSVAENIMLGHEPVRYGMINWAKMNATAAELLDRVGIHVDVTRPLMDYNIAIQQMVAIARAVSFESRLVIMDEPTSSLDEGEVEVLFQSIRRLKEHGVSTIFISHRLDELFEVCDRVTIMRDGKTIETSNIAEMNKLELVSKMLGREMGEIRRKGTTSFADAESRHTGSTVLSANQIGSNLELKEVTFEVKAGEIVGLAGLLGAGRTETARAIFGAEPITGGELNVKGQKVHFSSPRDAINLNIGYCSEDRKAEGIIPHLSVRENLTLAALPMLSKRGIVSRERQKQIVDEFIQKLGIKTSNPDQPIQELSGGNQQKALLARWLCLNPEMLILDEPTRGIDVGAKGEIQKIISSLAEKGVGVLMITSEMEELVEGSDRVVVMRDRRTVTELRREEITQDAIMHAMAHGEEGILSEGTDA